MMELYGFVVVPAANLAEKCTMYVMGTVCEGW